MKIRNVLNISYLGVLLIPIVCIFVAVGYNKSFNNRTQVKDYLNITMDLSKYEEIVDDPKLYKGIDATEQLDEICSRHGVTIILYNKTGRVIYSSEKNSPNRVQNDVLYKNLNEIRYDYNSYTLKKPVFELDKIVGFYEISIERMNLVDTLQRSKRVVLAILILVLIYVYIIIIRIINTRFTKPLFNLQYIMDTYAKEGKAVSISYKYDDEIGDVCNQFNEMIEEIEHAKDLIKQDQQQKEYTLASISHDLRSPLTTIRASAEMISLMDHIDEKRCYENMDMILAKCDYLNELIDDLVMCNFLSMTTSSLNLVKVDGEEFCEMLLEEFESTCDSKGLGLVRTIDVTYNMEVDPKYMTRLVENLVSNAIRYTPKGSSVYLGAVSTDKELPYWVDKRCKDELETFRNSKGIFLLVKNEGAPIPEEERQKLFELFYQSDAARNRNQNKGIGLGLSICRMIADKHGGVIGVVPIDNVGNIFYTYLQATEDI